MLATLDEFETTDVLARGIDVKGIDLVINFDVPGDGEDYVHRIGRTARAEASGVAITYVNRKDRKRFQRIEELIEAKIELLNPPADIPAVPVSGKSPARNGARKNPPSTKPSGEGFKKNKRRRYPPKKDQ